MQNKSHNKTISTYLIKCGRFDNIVPDLSREKAKLTQLTRIASRPPQKTKKKSFLLIATNGKEIYGNGSWSDARDYISKLSKNKKKRLMVLTQKEKHLIFDIEIETNCRIQSFETSFPIFEDIHLFTNPKRRIDYMEEKLYWLEKRGITASSIGMHNSIKNQYKVAKKIRFKNKLDTWFAFTNPTGIQEVFKVHEFRDDRAIVALDFNSMYPSCMKGNFPDPRKLKHYDFSENNHEPENLFEGIYRVQLIGFKKGPFKEIHPFMFNKTNKKSFFKGCKESSIECLLHKSEIEAYRKYFHGLRIIEGIAADQTIRHPLEKQAEILFKELSNYKRQGATTHSNIVKAELQSLYSATSRREYKTTFLKDPNDLSTFLMDNFYINLKECADQNQVKNILSNKYISATPYKDKIKVRHVNLSSDFNLFSLSSQVVSNARVKMMKIIEHILRVSSAEICYANTDSIHVSIKRTFLETLIEHLSPYISESMGDLKIQCIAENGLWLDTGRYWLINNHEVALYKNKIFNHKKNTNPYTRFRKIKKAHHSQAFSYVSSHAATIESSLTFKKRMVSNENLGHSTLERYRFDEIKNNTSAAETYAAEEAKSKESKLYLFNKAASQNCVARAFTQHNW